VSAAREVFGVREMVGSPKCAPQDITARKDPLKIPRTHVLRERMLLRLAYGERSSVSSAPSDITVVLPLLTPSPVLPEPTATTNLDTPFLDPRWTGGRLVEPVPMGTFVPML